jgi:type VI secretion system protein ImpG
LETRQRFRNAGEFELHFVLDRLPAGYESFQAENWKLFCTPVINIFPFVTQPQHVTQSPFGHKIVPDVRHPDHYAVYSVEQVSVWRDQGKTRAADKGAGVSAQEGGCEEDARYRLRVVPGMDAGRMDAYILLDEADQQGLLLQLRLLCTNSTLPERIQPGDIRPAGEGIGNTATPYKNILPVSPSLPAPCNDDTLWKLLSTMSLSNIALNDVPSFQAMIATHAFRAAYHHSHKRLLQQHLHGILSVKSEGTDRLFQCMPMRGCRTRIIMDQAHFSGEGGLYLFGAVLNEFLSLYATVHSFHQLVVKEAASGEEYHWPARRGDSFR